MKQRLFVAIPIPEHIKAGLLNGIRIPDGFRVTRPENIHATLLFLGDTEEDKIGEVTNALDRARTSFAGFELEISSFGQFPPKGPPSIIFVTGQKGIEELTGLASSVRSELKLLGITDSKEFRYHITVARAKDRMKAAFGLPDLGKKFVFRADEFILFRSELLPQGPRYTEIRKFHSK